MSTEATGKRPNRNGDGADRGGGVMDAYGPESQPIRRGDVVQVVSPLGAEDFDLHPVSIVMKVVGWNAILYYGGRQPLSRCVRVGRARFYPDGSPVED